MFRLIITVCLTLWGGAAVSADEFYAGKRISMVVNSSEGTGPAVQAQIIAKHLPNYIPGDPTIIVVAKPGAGGTLAANFINDVAAKDGMTLGYMSFLVLEKFFGNNTLRLDPQRVKTLLVFQRSTVTLAGANFVENAEAIYAKKPVMGIVSAPSPSNLLERLELLLLGIDAKIAPGYKSMTDTNMAVFRSETNIFIHTAALYNDDFKRQYGAQLVPLWTNADAPIDNIPTIAQAYAKRFGREPAGELWDAYRAFRSIYSAASGQLFLPEDSPVEARAILGQAIVRMFADPSFIEDFKRSYYGSLPGLVIGEPADRLIKEISISADMTRKLNALDESLR